MTLDILSTILAIGMILSAWGVIICLVVLASSKDESVEFVKTGNFIPWPWKMKKYWKLIESARTKSNSVLIFTAKLFYPLTLVCASGYLFIYLVYGISL